MRFHWFNNGSPSEREFAVMAKALDDAGYYSVLTVYHSTIDDSWLKIARTADKSHKFKYMMAVRTYSVSPEYLTMMCRTFDKMFPGRLMINFLAGDIKPDEDLEKGIVDYDDYTHSLVERIKYTQRFLEKFVTLETRKLTEIVIAGKSPDALETARKYGGYVVTMISEYMDVLSKPDLAEAIKKIKNKIVSVSILYADSEEEAKKKFEALHPVRQRWTMYGTEDSIIEKIMDLQKIGVTDVLLHASELLDGGDEAVHSIVKKANLRYNEYK